MQQHSTHHMHVADLLELHQGELPKNQWCCCSKSARWCAGVFPNASTHASHKMKSTNMQMNGTGARNNQSSLVNVQVSRRFQPPRFPVWHLDATVDTSCGPSCPPCMQHRPNANNRNTCRMHDSSMVLFNPSTGTIHVAMPLLDSRHVSISNNHLHLTHRTVPPAPLPPLLSPLPSAETQIPSNCSQHAAPAITATPCTCKHTRIHTT